MTRILTYHKISSDFEFGITTVRPETFKRHIRLFHELGLKSLAATRVVEGENSNVISITFDDGYTSVYEVAVPAMIEVGFTGTIFPVVGAIGSSNRWDIRLSLQQLHHMGWRELRHLAEIGFEIGSHSMTHSDLTRLGIEELRWELRVSKALLEDRIGKHVCAISYPFGKCSERVVEEALNAGYRYGFLSFANNAPDMMKHGRLSVYSIDTIRSLRRKLGIERGQRLEELKCKMISLLSRGTPLVKGRMKLAP